MASQYPDLSTLFGAALDALRNKRQRINDLDGYNGNHGDKMAHNVDVITQALRAEAGRPPATAAPANITPRGWRGPRSSSRANRR